MNEDLNQYLAQEMNQLDHITQIMYPGTKFEQLSAFGQNTIEELARKVRLVDEPNSQVRESKVENLELRSRIASLEVDLAKALRANEDLWNENEDLRMELHETEDDRDELKEKFKSERRASRSVNNSRRGENYYE